MVVGKVTHEDVDRVIMEIEDGLLPIIEELNAEDYANMKRSLEQAKDHTLPIPTRLSLIEMALRAAAHALGVDFNELWSMYY